MSYRDQLRAVQVALGLPSETATGIPNDDTANAFDTLWSNALNEYRATEAAGPGEPEPAPPVAPPSPGWIIAGNGWLEKAKRQEFPGGAFLKPVCLVLHFTAGARAQSSIDYWKELNNGVCAHLVVERDGTVTQCRPFNRTAGHAGPPGKSRWKDPATGTRIDGLNSASIGIEICNAGEDDGALSWARRQPGFFSIKARHRNGGPEVEWEGFPEIQLQTVRDISRALVKAYSLHDVTGHDCIAPERKTDPGPAFPMAAIRDACGFGNTLPVVYQP